MSVATDDPPFLPVGTEVSAKFKGAFCEAKIKSINRKVRCKVSYLNDSIQSVVTLEDTCIKTTVLKLGSNVQYSLNDSSVLLDGILIHAKDFSSYTVLFNDGDERILRRGQINLKGARHYTEAESLDNSPLLDPEQQMISLVKRTKLSDDHHYSNMASSCSTMSHSGTSGEKSSTDCEYGQMLCVYEDREHRRWFPAIVVAPQAQPSIKVKLRDEFLVRSFKDGRYSAVSGKQTSPFDIDVVSKGDNPNSLKPAIDKAVSFLDHDELPPHWDRLLMFGLKQLSCSEIDTSSDDDEQSDEKDRFVAFLYKFMDERGTPINKGPTLGGQDLDLYRLYAAVQKLGGLNKVNTNGLWKEVLIKLKLKDGVSVGPPNVKAAYNRYLSNFDVFYRKLGSSGFSYFGTSHTPRHRADVSFHRGSQRSASQESDTDSSPPGPSKQKVQPDPVICSTTALSATALQKKSKPLVVQETGVSGKSSNSRASKMAKLISSSRIPFRRISRHSSSSLRHNKPQLLTNSCSNNSPKKRPAWVAKARRVLGRVVPRPGLKPPGRSSSEERESDLNKELQKKCSRSTLDVCDNVALLPSAEGNSVDLSATNPTTAQLSASSSDDSIEDKASDPWIKVPESELSTIEDIKAGQMVRVKYGSGANRRFYKARIMECQKRSGNGRRYSVHYYGWNSRYDEFVSPVRIDCGSSVGGIVIGPDESAIRKATRPGSRYSECQYQSNTKQTSHRKRYSSAITAHTDRHCSTTTTDVDNPIVPPSVTSPTSSNQTCPSDSELPPSSKRQRRFSNGRSARSITPTIISARRRGSRTMQMNLLDKCDSNDNMSKASMERELVGMQRRSASPMIASGAVRKTGLVDFRFRHYSETTVSSRRSTTEATESKLSDFSFGESKLTLDDSTASDRSPPYNGAMNEGNLSPIYGSVKQSANKRKRRRKISHMGPSPRKSLKVSKNDKNDSKDASYSSTRHTSVSVLKQRLQRECDIDGSCSTRFSFIEIDPNLVGEHKILLLQQRMIELRECYAERKCLLNNVERKRKRSIEKQKDKSVKLGGKHTPVKDESSSSDCNNGGRTTIKPTVL